MNSLWAINVYPFKLSIRAEKACFFDKFTVNFESAFQDDPFFHLLSGMVANSTDMSTSEENFKLLCQDLSNKANFLCTGQSERLKNMWNETCTISDKFTPYIFDAYLCILPEKVKNAMDHSKPMAFDLSTNQIRSTISVQPLSLNVKASGGPNLANTLLIQVDIDAMVDTTRKKYTMELNTDARLEENNVRFFNIAYPRFYDRGTLSVTKDPIENLPIEGHADARKALMKGISDILVSYKYSIPAIENDIVAQTFSPYTIKIQNRKIFLLSRLSLYRGIKSFDVQNPFQQFYDLSLYISQDMLRQVILNFAVSRLSAYNKDHTQWLGSYFNAYYNGASCELDLHFSDSWGLGAVSVDADIKLPYDLQIVNGYRTIRFFGILGKAEAHIEASTPLGIGSGGVADQAKEQIRQMFDANRYIDIPIDLSHTSFRSSLGIFAQHGFIANLK
jgi:hypothetical protein